MEQEELWRVAIVNSTIAFAFEFAHLIVTTIEHGADLVNEVYNIMGLDMMHKVWLLTLKKVSRYV